MAAVAGVNRIDTTASGPKIPSTIPRYGNPPTSDQISGMGEPSEERPPTPPPKDTPTTPGTPMPDRGHQSGFSGDFSIYMRPGRLSRAGSVYSLSRVSFTSQISQLTAIYLPEPSTLSVSISSIATAVAASRALNEAAEQIQLWIQKASDVLGGLDAGDDAEWAAAAGREGLEEVDVAVTRFESLVQVYVASVEGLQLRQDASAVPVDEMQRMVGQVERVTSEWQRIKNTLGGVKHQVELAMEWEELRNSVLGEIGTELEDLSRVVFEMEERRHRGSADALVGNEQVVDLGELESIVHADPKKGKEIQQPGNKLFTGSEFPSSPGQSPTATTATAAEDSGLLSLFARMQPLRASLDFLPMKLSAFENRAQAVFPSACDELKDRCTALERSYQRLEFDAECLKKELGEDRWNLVFRNAGKQALKMIDSVERSITKLDESLGTDTQLKHAPSTAKKVENYQAKKLHYRPAIERVLAIMDRGGKDRLTVNGEIVRLRADIRQRWQAVQRSMQSMDAVLEEFATHTAASQQQLRDSLSSILSNDRSIESSALQTPGSSPPSSAGLSRSGSNQDAGILDTNSKPQPSSESPSTPMSSSVDRRRFSGLPIPSHKTPVMRSSAMGGASRTSQGSSPRSSSPGATRSTVKTATHADKPRWSYANKGNGDYDVSEYYKSLMAKVASPTASRTTSRSTSIQHPHTPSQRSSSAKPAAAHVTPYTISSSATRPTLTRKSSYPSVSQPPAFVAFTPTASKFDTPLAVRKRPDRAHESPALLQQTPPGQRDPIAPPQSKTLRGKMSMGALGGAGNRTSMIPIPTSHTRSASNPSGSK